MKALTKRSGVPIDDDDNGDVDESVISPTERGFALNYDKPPKYEANDNLIKRTVEILLGGYELDDSTGHYTCEGVSFNKKDCYFLAATFFENKKRAYQIPESADEGDEILPKSITRAKHVKARRDDYLACLAAQASLTSTERRRKVKLWEEKKPACRSKKLERIYKRLDKLMDKESEEEEKTKGVRMWARRVSLGNETVRIPRCKNVVWPFMVDESWLNDDRGFTKAAWTKLQQADPVGLDLQINTDSESSD
ncbi:hypothetical protein ACEPAG_2222 [Sanghuangporus baumii]